MKQIYCIIIVFLDACLLSAFVNGNKNEYFVEHNISWKGKEISFSLPCYYTDENLAENFFSKQNADYSEFVFYSTQNENCYFTLYICDDSSDFKGRTSETFLDELVANQEKSYWMAYPYEENEHITLKKKQKTG